MLVVAMEKKKRPLWIWLP